MSEPKLQFVDGSKLVLDPNNLMHVMIQHAVLYHGSLDRMIEEPGICQIVDRDPTTWGFHLGPNEAKMAAVPGNPRFKAIPFRANPRWKAADQVEVFRDWLDDLIGKEGLVNPARFRWRVGEIFIDEALWLLVYAYAPPHG